MQLMPGTAKMMAAKLGVEYDVTKLVDPDYNAILGAEYLATLRAEFGASLCSSQSGITLALGARAVGLPSAEIRGIHPSISSTGLK